jgi:hypothetical protein
VVEQSAQMTLPSIIMRGARNGCCLSFPWTLERDMTKEQTLFNRDSELLKTKLHREADMLCRIRGQFWIDERKVILSSFVATKLQDNNISSQKTSVQTLLDFMNDNQFD